MKRETVVMVARGLAVVVVAVVAALAGAPPACATTVSECQAAIAVLVADTQAATSLGARDAAGLLGKAQNAALKLDQGKFADALQKLLDYQATLDSLHVAARPKIGDADFATLSADVTAAITCVQNLINGV